GEAVARLAQGPLDRDAPLWQVYLMHGLAGGRQALYAKVHHAVVDGVSGAEVLGVLFDIEEHPRRVPPPRHRLRPERPPGRTEVLQETLTRGSDQAVSLVRAVRPPAVAHLARLAAAAARVRPAPPAP